MGILSNAENTIRNLPQNAWNFLLGSAENTFKDVGAGIAANQNPGTQESQNAALSMIPKVLDRANKTQDPQERQRLLSVAQQTASKVAQSASQQAKSFSPDVQQNPIQRGLTTGTQIASAADLGAKGLEFTGNLLSNPLGTIGKTITAPFKAAGQVGNAIKSLGSMSQEELVNLLKSSPQAVADFIKNDWENSFKLPSTPGPTPVVAGSAGTAGSNAPEDLSASKNLGNRFLRQQYQATGATDRAFTQEHLNQLADYGLTTPKQVLRGQDIFADGEHGIGPKLVRKAISQASPVNIGEVTGADGVVQPSASQVAQEIIDQTNGITDRDASVFMNKTAIKLDKLPGAQANIDGTITTSPTEKDPSAVYDFMNSIRKDALNLLKKTDPANQALGQAYYQFYNELEDRLYVNSGANAVMNNISLSPEEITKLNSVSPKLTADVQDALQNGTVGDLRHTMQPFVTGGNAAEQTMESGKKAPISMRKVLEFYIGLHNPAGLAIAAADTGMGQNLIGKTLRAVGSMGAPTGEAAAATLPLTPDLLPTAAAASGQLATHVVNNPQDQNNTTNEPPQNQVAPPPTSIAPTTAKNNDVVTIPQSVDQVQPVNGSWANAVPNVSKLTSSNGPVAMDQVTYNTELKRLNDKSAKDWASPAALAQDKADISTLESKYNSSKDLLAKQKQVTASAGIIDEAEKYIASAGLLGKVKSLNDLLTSTNKEYALFGKMLKNIQDQVPGFSADQMLQTSSPQVAKALLDNAAQQLIWSFSQSGMSANVGNNEIKTDNNPPQYPPPQQPLPTQPSWQPMGSFQGLVPIGGGGGLDKKPTKKPFPKRYEYR